MRAPTDKSPTRPVFREVDMAELGFDDLGTMRPLNVYQLRRLKRIRPHQRAVAPAAFALGLTVREFTKLPPEAQQGALRAYGILTHPRNV